MENVSKEDIFRFIFSNNLTQDELNYIYDFIFYLYTEDYDLLCDSIKDIIIKGGGSYEG